MSDRAVPWLDRQWEELMALRSSGVPVKGFTWYSLTDQIDWQHALRVERNELHPVGLYDLKRRRRPVGQRYQEIVRAWRARLNGETPAEAQSA